MDAALLFKLFGREQHWHGPCTVIVNGNVAVQALGGDSIVQSATKVYAPRVVSGRYIADAVCLLADGSAMLIVQQQRNKQQTGEEIVKQSLSIMDTKHIIGFEFLDTSPLLALGLPVPAIRTSGSHSGIHTRPKSS